MYWPPFYTLIFTSWKKFCIPQEKKFLFCLLWTILYRVDHVRSSWKSGSINSIVVIWGISFETTTYFYLWHLNIHEMFHKGFSWHLILAALENVFLWCPPYPTYTESQKANFSYAIKLTFKNHSIYILQFCDNLFSHLFSHMVTYEQRTLYYLYRSTSLYV